MTQPKEHEWFNLLLKNCFTNCVSHCGGGSSFQFRPPQLSYIIISRMFFFSNAIVLSGYYSPRTTCSVLLTRYYSLEKDERAIERNVPPLASVAVLLEPEIVSRRLSVQQWSRRSLYMSPQTKEELKTFDFWDLLYLKNESARFLIIYSLRGWTNWVNWLTTVRASSVWKKFGPRE